MFYAGIGSRQVPREIIDDMTSIARLLEKRGWRLRSGGAHGSDLAFQLGTQVRDIYIPWNGFNGFYDSMTGFIDVTKKNNYREAELLAKKYHPKGAGLKGTGLKFMARNAYQVLGDDLNTPSEMIICWTPDGVETTTTNKTGGTGQAIRMAIDLNIPVFNLYNQSSLEEVRKWFEK